MDEAINPLAGDHHLAWFITAPGHSDTLLIAMGIFLIAVMVTIGNLYFQLHALPEKWAHRTSPVQIQIVAVLGLLALFTHNHIFWIAALLLAMVQFPDFSTPIYSIANSLSRMAGRGGLATNDAEPSARNTARRHRFTTTRTSIRARSSRWSNRRQAGMRPGRAEA